MQRTPILKTKRYGRHALALLTVSAIGLAVFALLQSDSLFAQERTQSMNIQNHAISPMHQQAAEKFKQALAKSEGDYQLVLEQEGSMDTQPIYLFRYQPRTSLSINLGGSHLSIVVDQNNRLKGLARINESLLNSPLLSEADAEAASNVFLTEYAPDLLNGANLQWIKPHDETVRNSQGKKFKLTGMKAKYRNSNGGLYFWVIVGSDGNVIIFERDIEWDFAHAGRRTEKWLHDDWLKKHIR